MRYFNFGKNEKGFAAFEVLIVVAVVFVLLISGSLIALKLASNSDKTSTDKTTTTKATTGIWRSYINDAAGITFNYPSDWQNKPNDNVLAGDQSLSKASGSLVSPSGKKLEWVYSPAGGKGGECVPNSGDVAFSEGNKCPTKQILSATQILSIKKPTGYSGPNLFEDKMYITHTKFRQTGRNTPITYHICLDAYSDDSLPKTGTTMGFATPCKVVSGGFNVRFDVPDEAGYSSDEAKTAEKIMKTFNSL